MTHKSNRTTECGPFIACGAAAVSFDHKPGDPTSVDRAFSAIKHFLKHESSAPAEHTSTEVLADNKAATAHSF